MKARAFRQPKRNCSLIRKLMKTCELSRHFAADQFAVTFNVYVADRTRKPSVADTVTVYVPGPV